VLKARQTKFTLIALALILSSSTTTADTSIALFDLSGTVPSYFSVTTRGIPGDLDLTPNVTVLNRPIGLLHFKYNINVGTLVISSDTASGGPEATSGATYNFQGGGFQVSIDSACASVAPTYYAPFTLTNAGIDVRSVLAGALVNTGIEEDCQVLASWRGTTQKLPLAGLYKLGLTVTMTSL
jgi:hypothetical protein